MKNYPKIQVTPTSGFWDIVKNTFSQHFPKHKYNNNDDAKSYFLIKNYIKTCNIDK
jgi:hypothetical protein